LSRASSGSSRRHFFRVRNSARADGVVVSADGRGLVSQAGAVLLCETMRVTGLARGLSAGLARWRAPRAVHDPGKVIADLRYGWPNDGPWAGEIAAGVTRRSLRKFTTQKWSHPCVPQSRAYSLSRWRHRHPSDRPKFDPVKSASNREKHGVDFVQAQELWQDPMRIEVAARTTGEPRWLVVGRMGGRHWSAVVTYREDRIRIISVRRARDEEVRIYEV
jgi:uncharacterized DUF497 family protein